ncbi:MAG: hypothetical protein PUD24_06945 [Oscillospiraceae bacterium]|nr:hypothetical protein [Oscillospiraceae bacterium]
MMKLKAFGIEIYVSFTVVALFSIFVLFDKSGNLICCFISAFCHETGHIFTMCRFNMKPEKIRISLFDIKILDNNRNLCSYNENLAVVLSGSAANFLLFIIAGILFLFIKAEILLRFSAVNLFTGMFNLLPVSNLDGGQALYLLLIRRFSEKTTDRIIDFLTVLLILPTAVIGFIVLFKSKYNFSLLLISVYLLSALILRKSKFY